MNTTHLTPQRVRHELKMRHLQVARITLISPHLLRVTLTGDDLADFVSSSFDDHVKVFFSQTGDKNFVMPARKPDAVTQVPASPDELRPAKRDYTPRRFDATRCELDLEFVLHGDGPAANWASHAKVGDTLNVGGPRGSFIIPKEFDWHLLIGDEAALPAIGRRLDELPDTTRAIAIIEVESANEQVSLSSKAHLDVIWVHRATQATGGLESALRGLTLPSGEGFAWVAGETSAVRAVYKHLVNERGIDKSRIRASGYWKRGTADVHETIDD